MQIFSAIVYLIPSILGSVISERAIQYCTMYMYFLFIKKTFLLFHLFAILPFCNKLSEVK